MHDESDDRPEFVMIDGIKRKIDYSGNLGREPVDEELDGPSYFERWQVMAENGDIQGLLDEASRPVISDMMIEELRHFINAAVDKRARENPAAFSTYLQTEMVACAGRMTIRAQYLLDQQLRGQRTGLKIWIENPNIDAIADKVRILMAENAKLLHASAVTQLALERVRKMRLANDKAEAKKNRPRQPRRRRTSPRPHVMTSTSRIGGELP